METLIKRVQEQLDNNWCVSADDIQKMAQYIREAIQEKMEREKIEPKQTEDKE